MPRKVGGTESRRDRSARACRVPDARSLLLPYALSKCREAEALRFEAHLLACEVCFQDLKVLDRTGDLIREFVEARHPALDRLRGAAPLAPQGTKRAPKHRTPSA